MGVAETAESARNALGGLGSGHGLDVSRAALVLESVNVAMGGWRLTICLLMAKD